MNTTIPVETFAWRLRQHREEQGLTQGQLARAVEYDRSYLSYLERGLRNPTREVVLHLATALGLNHSQTDELLISARFAPEHDTATSTVNLNDRVVELISRTINQLSEPDRQAFRKELESYVHYLLTRYEPLPDSPELIQALSGRSER
jgi:transcriptional regulator with XRE-family HTH domain